MSVHMRECVLKMFIDQLPGNAFPKCFFASLDFHLYRKHLCVHVNAPHILHCSDYSVLTWTYQCLCYRRKVKIITAFYGNFSKSGNECRHIISRDKTDKHCLM